jgi:hypothetical protein
MPLVCGEGWVRPADAASELKAQGVGDYACSMAGMSFLGPLKSGSAHSVSLPTVCQHMVLIAVSCLVSRVVPVAFSISSRC